jgi:hypothetical protein
LELKIKNNELRIRPWAKTVLILESDRVVIMSTENLHDLIANLYNAERVAGIEEDIRIGDEIIASGDTLAPDAEVIGNIKNDIAKRLTARRRRRMNTVSMRTAVAAMIVIVAFIGIRNMTPQGDSQLPQNISRGFFWGEDATASNIAYELDEMDDAIMAISLGEEDTESEDIIGSLELEIIEDNGGLWK